MLATWLFCSLSFVPLPLQPDTAGPPVPQDEASASEEPQSLEEVVAGWERREGLWPVYLDADAGRVAIELPAPDADGLLDEALSVEGLTSGLGSNDLGLDRGQLGPARLVRFRMVGPLVMLEVPNLGFRAQTSDPAEAAATRQSFATSVVYAQKPLARGPEGTVLVELTGFAVRDAHGVVETLQRQGEGGYRLDGERSTLDPSACFSFPDNLELEAVLTFSGSATGRHVPRTVPVSDSITLIQHHSFIRLPDSGYHPRPFDPRSGAFSIAFRDQAAPLARPLTVRWAVRHRLQKQDVNAESSPPLEPIVYYVDRGAPEPVRGALVEGASWWSAAFEAAGFPGGFRVELLPEGAHPLDVRYNVIQWVHRSTRGWSYGGGIQDPRTGEMIKGHVTLGSLRIRQDRLLFEGLLGTRRTGTGSADDPIELALARLRQLSAHEVGHTLGLSHNFAASTYGDRASVMDYPAPLIEVTEDGRLDTSRAYGVGIGAWDKVAIRWLYSDFPDGADENAELQALLREAERDGLLYLSDRDARPAGAAHPLANLWDNGSDPVAGLKQTLDVRRLALESFGRDRLQQGEPLALLHEVLVPVYLHHRYQVDAAAKVIGGVDYGYGLRGEGARAAHPVSPERQRQALEVLLTTIEPGFLDLPESIVELLLPRPPGHASHGELFDGNTGLTFDPMAAATTAAQMTVRGLLHPERLARVFDHSRRDPNQVTLDEILGVLLERVTAQEQEEARLEPLRELVADVLARELMALSQDPRATPHVRAHVDAAIGQLLISRAASFATYQDLLRYQERKLTTSPSSPTIAAPPPGSPIGSDRPGHFRDFGCDSGRAWLRRD